MRFFMITYVIVNDKCVILDSMFIDNYIRVCREAQAH